MTVNRTTLLDLPIITTGTESGAWGNITNNGLSQYMDIAIAGMTSLTSANFTAGALTIANTQGDSSATNIAAGSAQYATIKVSSLAANSTITAPSSNRAYRIINADGTYTLTIKASGQTGVTFPINTSGIAVFNGTDYVLLGSYVIASAGTASLPSITTTGDTNTGIYFPAADTIAFTEGGAESMRIDSSGNLGLGVTPSAWALSGSGALQVKNAGFAGYLNNAYVTANQYFTSSGGSNYIANGFASMYIQQSGQHQFFSAASGTAGNTISFTQAMTLDASGNLLVGDTAQPVNNATARLGVLQSIADYIQVLRNSNASPYGIYIKYDTDTNNSTNSFIAAVGNATTRFLVTSNGNVTNTNNSYGGISDVKLKENIADATPKLNDLLQVRVVNYNLKSQPDQKHIGVIAQELEQVFPGLIEESQDRDTDGELTGETIKSVKYSVFVPMLIKAMQEQQALITALTARVAALEGTQP